MYRANLRHACDLWVNPFAHGVSKRIASTPLESIFLPDAEGKRPVFGGTEVFQTDPHWKDHLLFYEYFHGDNGAGPGASHQTGWSAVVATLIQIFGHMTAERLLRLGANATSISVAQNDCV